MADSTLRTHGLETFGSVDILVKNAGLIHPITRIADSDPEIWGKVIVVNVEGVYHGLLYAVSIMREQENDSIINISSEASNSFLDGRSHYCTTKAAVLHLIGVARKE